MVANNKDIVGEILRFKGGKMTPQVARQVLKLEVSPAVQRRVTALLEKNQEGSITPAEHDWLQSCIMMGDVVDLLKTEAQLALLKKRKRKNQAA